MKRTLVLLTVAACGSSSTNPAIDAGGTHAVDAPVNAVDAPPGTPDGPISTVDAPPGTPDGPISVADATPTAVDAHPIADAAGQMCLPQCYITALAQLFSPCVPTGSCTTNTTISGQTVTITTCYANGVKFVNQASSAGSMLTVKTTSGDVCYTLTSTLTSQTSSSSVYKDSSGTQIVKIDIPNTDMPNIEDVTCDSQSPVVVDLNSASCQAEHSDAGPAPDAGTTGCTTSASCTP